LPLLQRRKVQEMLGSEVIVREYTLDSLGRDEL